jgi:hypothetical protein
MFVGADGCHYESSVQLVQRRALLLLRRVERQLDYAPDVVACAFN